MVSCSSIQYEQAAPYQQTIETAREIGNSLISQPGNVTAVTIAVMHEGKIVYSDGFGRRDIELDLPVDGHTRFNIGSVSKTFIAASILLLQEEGKLELDDLVADLLPDFTMVDERYRDITVRMLLNHVSGMAGTNWRDGFSATVSPTYLHDTLEELGQSSLKHDPGAYSPYCNDGFTVAQALVEHLQGIPYPQFLQERIFTPMQLNDTSVGFHPQENNMAYAYADRSSRLPVEIVNIVASGGLTSTAEDLCKYAALTFSPSVLKADSLAEYLAEQKPDYVEDLDFDRTLTFGLGWDFTSWQPYQQLGVQVLGKTGGTFQYTTMLFVVPRSRSVVALICSGQIEPISQTLPIMDALLKETGQIPPEGKNDPPEAPGEKPLPEDYQSYEGYYGSPSALYRIEFNRESSSMQLYRFEGQSFELRVSALHIGEGIYRDPEGTQFALRTVLGVPALLNINGSHAQAEIQMTRLPELPEGLEHGFTETTWLPTNFLPNDLYLQYYSTSFIAELPSYLILDGSGTIPYAISSATGTTMALPVVRDQTPPRLAKDGQLIVGSFKCTDVLNIQPLVDNERIEVGADNSSVWRKLEDHVLLSCKVPSGGRIIVLGSDYDNIYDTLYDKEVPSNLEFAGGYVAFIADSPTIFEPSFVPAGGER
jgi:CubicO group peptidase (beta-lactamase class C family)